MDSQNGSRGGDDDRTEYFKRLDERNSLADMQDHLRRYGKRPIQPKTIKAVINRLLATQGYGQQRSNDQLAEAWKQAIPSELVKDSTTGKISRGHLEVIVANPAALQQLTFAKNKIVKHLQQALPHAGIKNLRFRLGP